MTEPLRYNSMAEEIEEALESLPNIDDVIVNLTETRTDILEGNATTLYCRHGWRMWWWRAEYYYTVTFVGAITAGNLPKLRLVRCCSGALMVVMTSASSGQQLA